MKTIEEKAQEACLACVNKLYDKNGNNSDYFKRGFKECAKFMQQWISVEEELPNEENGYFDKEVLVKRYKDFERTEIEYKVTRYTIKGWEEYSRITHWRPIEIK